MACGCSNRAESNIDGLSVGPSGLFYQNLGRLRNVLNMLFTFCVDFDRWSMIIVDSPPLSVCSLSSFLHIVRKSIGSLSPMSEAQVCSN
jgi:hypothetical protein